MSGVVLSKEEALKSLGITGGQVLPKDEALKTLGVSEGQVLTKEQALKSLDTVNWAADEQKTAANLQNIADIRRQATISPEFYQVQNKAENTTGVQGFTNRIKDAYADAKTQNTAAFQNTALGAQYNLSDQNGGYDDLIAELSQVKGYISPDQLKRVNSAVSALRYQLESGYAGPDYEQKRKTLQVLEQVPKQQEGSGILNTLYNVGQGVSSGVKGIANSIGGAIPTVVKTSAAQAKVNTDEYSRLRERLRAAEQYLKDRQYYEANGLTVQSPWNNAQVLDDVQNIDALREKVNSMSAPAVEPNERTLAAEQYNTAMTHGVTEPAAKFGAEAAYSAANMGASFAIAGGNPTIALGLMGTQSAASEMAKLKQQGATLEQQTRGGIVAGALEVMTEKLPFDNFVEAWKVGGKNAAERLVKGALKAALPEAGEEFSNTVLGNMASSLNMGTPQDLQSAQWWKDTLGEAVYSAAQGAVSGALMGTPAAFNGNNTSQQVNQVQTAPAESVNKPTLSSSNPMVQHLLDMRDKNAQQENRKNSLNQNEASGQISRRVQRAMDATGKKLGVSIVMDETLHGDNGHYDPKTKSIHIAMDAADPLRVVFTHEVTHRLKETSPQLYGEFKDAAFKIMQEAGTLDTVRAAVSEAYSDPAVLDDEVIAHFTRRMTEDIGEFEKLVGVNRNLAQKIFDMLDDLIRKAKVSWNGLGVSSQNDDSLFGNLSPEQLEAVRDRWRAAFGAADANAQGSGTVSEMVRMDAAGNPYVEISDNILNGVSQTEIAKTVNQYLQTHDIDISGRTVAVNAATRNEYHNSGYTGNIKANEPQKYMDKMRAAKEIDEIVQTSENAVDEAPKHPRRDNFKSFKRSKVTLQIGQNEYDADVVVGVTSSGKEVLYDVVNMTPTTIKKPSQQILMPQKATSSPDIGMVSNTNIPQEGNGVNDHYMQQNAKNSKEKHSKNLDSKKYSDMQHAGVDMKAVLRENDTLRKMNEALKAQFELTAPGTHDRGSIKGIARSLLKNWAGTMDTDTLTDRLQSLYDGVAQGKMKWDSLRSEADSLARELLENAEVKTNSTGYGDTEVADIRASLRNVKKTISETDRADLGEPYSDFRRRNFGRIGLVNEGGLPVDVAYSELSGMYPDLFPENITHPADQLKRMEEVSHSLDWKNENPYQYDMSSFSQQLGDEIIDSFWNAKERRTFADKMNKTAQLKQAELSNRIENLKGKLVQTKQEAQRRVERIQANQRTMKQNETTRRTQSQTRQQLLNAARRFEKLLGKTTPDMKKRITETSEFSEYMNIIKDIDTQGVSILKNGYMTKDGRLVRGEADLRALREAYNDAVKENPDFLRNPEVEKDILRLDKKQIADMSIEDVETLINVIQAATHEIQNANELIDTERRIEVYRARKQMIEELESAKKKRSTSGLKKGIETLYNVNSLRPKTFFERISGFKDDGITMRLYNSMEDGQTKMLDFQRKALKPFDDFSKQHSTEMRKWTGEDAEVIDTLIRTPKGQKVEITPMMRIALALHATNDQNLAHIKDGGLTIPDIALLKKGKIEEAYANSVTVKLEPSQVRTIAAGMSQSERAFFKLARAYFNETSKQALNETSVKLLGYEIAKVDNYFPIKTDKNFGYSNFESLVKDGTIEGMGMLKARTDARTPIMMIPADAAITQQIADTSKYVGMAIPLRNFTKVWSGGLMGYENSVQKQLQNSIGPEGIKYIEKLMKDIQSPKRSSDFTAGLRGNFAAAVLNANPSVALSQAASYPTAAAELGYKALAEGLVNGKVDTDIIAKYTPLLWYRSLGYMNADLADMKKANRLAQKLPGTKWIQGADLFTVGRLWKASEAWTKNNTDLKPGTDEFYQKVAEKFNRVVYDTQPNYTTLQRPDLLRSDSELAKSVMMFSTQRMQNYNMMYEATQRLQTAKEAYDNNKTAANKKALAEAKKGMASNAAALLVANAVYTAMKAAVAGLVDRDKDYQTETGGHTAQSIVSGYFSNYAKNMSGSIAFGTELMEAAEAVLTDGNMYDVEVPQIALISDLVGGGAKLANNIKSMVEEMADTNSTIWQYMSKYPDKILGNTRRFALSLSKVTGLPVENWEKYMTGILGQIHPAIKARYDNAFKRKTSTDISAAKDSRKYRATFDTVLENNLGEVSQELSDELFSLYGETGKQAIPAALPKTVAGAEITPKQYSAANSEYEKLAKEAMTALIASRMYDRKNAEAKAKLVAMASDVAKDMAIKKAAGTDNLSKWESAAADYGDSKILAAFVMAQFAYENETPADKKNGKTVNGSKKEKFEKYLKQLDLTTRQREYIFNYYYPKG